MMYKSESMTDDMSLDHAWIWLWTLGCGSRGGIWIWKTWVWTCEEMDMEPGPTSMDDVAVM